MPSRLLYRSKIDKNVASSLTGCVSKMNEIKKWLTIATAAMNSLFLVFIVASGSPSSE